MPNLFIMYTVFNFHRTCLVTLYRCVPAYSRGIIWDNGQRTNPRDKKSTLTSDAEMKPEPLTPCVNPGNPVFSCMLDPKTLHTTTSLSKPQMIMYKTNSSQYGAFSPRPQFFPCKYIPTEQTPTGQTENQSRASCSKTPLGGPSETHVTSEEGKTMVPNLPPFVGETSYIKVSVVRLRKEQETEEQHFMTQRSCRASHKCQHIFIKEPGSTSLADPLENKEPGKTASPQNRTNTSQGQCHHAPINFH
ncbi:hypothetical protein U0070_026883 [Myodes glareolus]|uniref:Uncharacterized protein n=1 Tax=Myodes glareolus TaxID=447135 RepID=A0AAW0K0Y0_MYOGA